MVPLPSWLQKLELNDLSISELFEDLLKWNLEYKLTTPKNITGTYFVAILANFNFSFSFCFLYVMFFLTPERAHKAGPATCIIFCYIVLYYITLYLLYYIIWYFIMLYYIKLYYTIFYYSRIYYIILHFIILYYSIVY